MSVLPMGVWCAAFIILHQISEKACISFRLGIIRFMIGNMKSNVVVLNVTRNQMSVCFKGIKSKIRYGKIIDSTKKKKKMIANCILLFIYFGWGPYLYRGGRDFNICKGCPVSSW